jgi:hypothetical protein
MLTSRSDGSSNLTIGSGQVNLAPIENTDPVAMHSGILNGNQTWSANSVHVISSHLTVPYGDTLQIEEGCWVLIDSAVNILVEGHVKVLGTAASPVVFTANNNAGWGGLICSSGTANLQLTICNNGGNDASLAYGHSDSQATIKSDGGNVRLSNCFIFDCQGKGVGAQNGFLEFVDGGISRCDMGGEFTGSRGIILGSHILDIPNDDGIFQDDDNDALYFSGANATNDTSVVDSCVFIQGKDDAIDHNGAILAVRNCWIEGFENEGIAASNQNSVTVFNSLFKHCEQGIEAGYGSPSVTVNHCVMVENDYGLRFGDWYDWGCAGTITCTNSIMVNNSIDNVHNFDLLSNGPIVGAIDLTYGIPNDNEYDAGTGCLVGTPMFTLTYQLEPNSLGVGAASDGLNMGLIPPVITGTAELTMASSETALSYNIYSVDGKLVKSKSGAAPFSVVGLQLPLGIYVVEEIYLDHRKVKKVAVIQ